MRIKNIKRKREEEERREVQVGCREMGEIVGRKGRRRRGEARGREEGGGSRRVDSSGLRSRGRWREGK